MNGSMNSSLFTPDFGPLTGLLQHLNDEELNELLNNDEKLLALIKDLKQVHDIEAEREMLIAGNKSISEYNLSKEPILEEQRNQVEETRKIAFELKDSLLEKKKKIENCQPATSKDTLLALLQAATSEKEEEAEATVEHFLQNELPVDDFLPKYLEMRKTAHLRRIKAEKLSLLLQDEGSRNIMPPIRSQKLRKPPPPPQTGSSELPYPASNAMTQGNQVQSVRPAPFPPVRPVQPYVPYPPPQQYMPYPGQPAQPYNYGQPQGYAAARPPWFGHYK